MMPGDDGQADDFCWDALVARVLHPVQVEIIEALRWIDQSLTAADLLRVFDEERVGLRIERRLRQLARLDAVALEDDGKTPMTRSYRLMKRPGL